MEATEKAVAKFHEKPFEWGRRDCVHLAAFVLRELGHPDPLANVGRYTTLLGAKRAMRRAGVKDFADYIDQMGFVRIAPAAALQGDLIGLPGQHGMLALGVSLGQDRVLAFAPNHVASWVSPSVCTHAWRVTPGSLL